MKENTKIQLRMIREGKGKEYYMNNGSLIYNGSFSNGKRHGEGILYENGKIVYDGKWENGMRKIENGNQGNQGNGGDCNTIAGIFGVFFIILGFFFVVIPAISS